MIAPPKPSDDPDALRDFAQQAIANPELLKHKKPIEGPRAHSEEWYAIRKFDPERERPVVFGASESAAICNVSKYSSALEIYMRKRGEIPELEFDVDQQERIDFGNRLEPVIVQAYQERTGCDVERGLPFFYHPEISCLGATPDGIARRSQSEWGVEAKCANFRMFSTDEDDLDSFGEPGTDQVPRDYMWQAQHQSLVMGYDKVDFPVLKNGNQLLVYEVNRVESIAKMIVASAQELAERIIAGEPPEPNFRMESARSLIHDLYGVQIGKVVELTVDEEALWERKKALSEEEKQIKSELNEINSKLHWALGDAERGLFPGGGGIKKTVVNESYVTQRMVDEMAARLGQIYRNGHVRLYPIKK